MSSSMIDESAIRDTWTMFQLEYECSVDRMARSRVAK